MSFDYVLRLSDSHRITLRLDPQLANTVQFKGTQIRRGFIWQMWRHRRESCASARLRPTGWERAGRECLSASVWPCCTAELPQTPGPSRPPTPQWWGYWTRWCSARWTARVSPCSRRYTGHTHTSVHSQHNITDRGHVNGRKRRGTWTWRARCGPWARTPWRSVSGTGRRRTAAAERHPETDWSSVHSSRSRVNPAGHTVTSSVCHMWSSSREDLYWHV